jgi:hypothetical protein
MQEIISQPIEYSVLDKKLPGGMRAICKDIGAIGISHKPFPKVFSMEKSEFFNKMYNLFTADLPSMS